jgi:hypothetical protein
MPCIVVMGCYRSGTSAVAGILHNLGVHMGNNFQEPNEQNPKGYFEDPEFVAVNLEIYKASIVKYADEFSKNSELFEAKKKFNYLCESRAIAMASEDSCGRPTKWGFKDPKFCLTAKHVELPSETKIIWIHRNVTHTALSIIKAIGDLSGSDAHLDKWEKFVDHYRNETEKYLNNMSLDSMDINFDTLMKYPRAGVNRIATFIEHADGHQHAFDYMHPYEEF